MTKHILVAALAMMACSGTGLAAEKIRYEEVPNRLAPFGSVLCYRGFHVTTLDGKKHSGRRLRLESDHVRVFHLDNSFEDLPSEQLSRIEITQTGRFVHHIGESGEIPVAAMEILGLAGVLFAPVWAYTLASAPFYLAADGVAFFIPSKVYEIAH